jgi:hypothetical protein
MLKKQDGKMLKSGVQFADDYLSNLEIILSNVDIK